TIMSLSNKYYPLMLEANPFPLTPVPTRIWILGGESRINALKRIKEEIEYSFRLEEPKIDMLIGDAGSGKTHLALHLQYLLSQEKPSQPFSYLSTIQDSVYKPSLIFFTLKVIESLGGEGFLKEMSSRLHQSLISRMKPGLIDEAISTNIFSIMMRKGRTVSDVLDRVLQDFRSVDELIEKGVLDLTKLVKIELQELAQTFEVKFEPHKSRRFIDLNLAKWVLWLPHSYYGVWGMKHINDYIRETDDNALKFLTTMVNLSKLISNSPFVIVVDEVETLLEDNVDVFFHTLKRIIDNGPGGLFILLLLTPRMFEDLKSQKFRVAPAIVSRVSSAPISLEKISIVEAKDIVDKYVKALYLDKNSDDYTKMFPLNSLKLLWANSGGEIRRLLSECFTCIEILAERIGRGLTEPMFVDPVIAMEAITKMGLPFIDTIAPIEPDSDVKNQIISRFYNIEKPSERSMIIEKAILTLMETGLGRDSIMGRKRISVSLTKKREVDLLFTDTTSGGIRVGVVIKVSKPREALGIDSIESLIDLAKSRKIDKLILLTTNPLDSDSQSALKQFENVKVLFLDDDKISTLLYVSQVFKNLSRPERLNPEVSLEVLRKIGIID
ncbi:MAG: restriction endonuclease, partial [Nitrososphaerota archaeon]|nr:restriction endonuclease [Nitrososphaerota archaeon]